MRSQRTALSLITFALCLGAGCGGARGGIVWEQGRAEALVEGEALWGRVVEGPHGYFRWVNREFTRRVCEVFAEEVRGAPPVNLHGDAHLEQYAVTEQGYGLTDFDDASVGPAVVDLARFGVSLWLAGDALGWGQAVRRSAWEAFLEGYTRGLRGGESARPGLVSRVRGGFDGPREAALAKAEAMMEPIDFDRQVLEAALADYARVAGQEAGRGEAYYRLKRAGYLRMGVGSALDEKYLLRVEGPSPAPEDDVVLEAKAVRDLGAIPCVEGAQSRGALRVLVGQARIAYQPQQHLGTMTLRNKAFWLHAWDDHYQELAVAPGFATETEWVEVARDVGVQLGLGHPRLIASPLDLQLREELILRLERGRGALDAGVERLVGEVYAGWRALRREVGAD